MPALHIRDVSEATVAAIKRRAARHGHSVQQELRAVLDRAAAEPIAGGQPRSHGLFTVETDVSASFDREDYYGDDER